MFTTSKICAPAKCSYPNLWWTVFTQVVLAFVWKGEKSAETCTTVYLVIDDVVESKSKANKNCDKWKADHLIRISRDSMEHFVHQAYSVKLPTTVSHGRKKWKFWGLEVYQASVRNRYSLICKALWENAHLLWQAWSMRVVEGTCLIATWA